MIKKIKKHKDVFFAVGIGMFLAVGGLLIMSGIIMLPSEVNAATSTTQTVAVTATVSEWLSFSVSPTSTTLSPNLVDTAGNTAIGSSTDITLTIGTNATSGWSATIEGQNNGIKSSTYTIDSVTATGTIVANSDGYGAKAATSTGGVSIGAYYGLSGALDVGEIRTVARTFLSKSTANATAAMGTMKIYAACDSAQAPGSYTDTVTLTVTTSP